MRYAIASDIHGSTTWCERLLDDIEKRSVDRVVLLGDLMYHGPRNALPDGYDPAAVANILNGFSDRILAVRGNCDSEVDQMLLDFPCMSDYTLICDEGVQLLCTHGHLKLSAESLHLPDGSVFISGHTHIKRDDMIDGIRHLNPGSVSIPKDGSSSYMIYDSGNAEFITLSNS